jgi:hypothetical protein
MSSSKVTYTDQFHTATYKKVPFFQPVSFCWIYSWTNDMDQTRQGTVGDNGDQTLFGRGEEGLF